MRTLSAKPRYTWRPTQGKPASPEPQPAPISAPPKPFPRPFPARHLPARLPPTRRSNRHRRVWAGAPPRLRVDTAMAAAGAMPIVLAVDAIPLTQLHAVLPRPRRYARPTKTGTGKKTPGGAGTHTDTGHARDTRAHTGTRITQTNLTTIQTQRHTRTTVNVNVNPHDHATAQYKHLPVQYRCCTGTVRYRCSRTFHVRVAASSDIPDGLKPAAARAVTTAAGRLGVRNACLRHRLRRLWPARLHAIAASAVTSSASGTPPTAKHLLESMHRPLPQPGWQLNHRPVRHLPRCCMHSRWA